jgi:hypothetical protein
VQHDGCELALGLEQQQLPWAAMSAMSQPHAALAEEERASDGMGKPNAVAK